MIKECNFAKGFQFYKKGIHVQSELTSVIQTNNLDKGLVTKYGEGGLQNGGGGAREVLPLRKGGAEKVLAMLKGGAENVLG